MGLIADQVERVLGGGGAAEPFARLQPAGVAGTVVIAETGDAFAEQLDTAAGCGQGVGGGVGAEPIEHHDLGLGLGQVKQALGPEGVERWQLDARLGRALARLLVHQRQPCAGIAPFGEGLVRIQPFGQIGKDGVVVARLAHWVDQLPHRDHVTLARGVADVLALQRRGGGQHDVRQLGGGCPVLLVDDDGFRLGLPRRQQAVQVLVVVERVAAGPVDQANVRIAVALAVVVETGAGLLQHVGDARHRDEGADGVAALRHRGAGKLGVVVADHVGGAIADAEPAAGQTDLAQHGGHGDQGPVRLFAMVRALQ